VSRLTRPAVFLDRDGTLNESPGEHRYVRSPDGFVWIQDAKDALTLLARAGYALVVVSNQRGIARGLVTKGVLAEIEERMQEDLGRSGCRIEAFRYCPHDLDERCSCRKPEPGLLLGAARELELDLARSWMIGDSPTDVAAGRAAGCRTLLVGSAANGCEPDLVADSLLRGAELVTALSEGRT
jgi:D-glycero-D-manno-heptose 1,7-bisphosphate phosphatase